MNNRTTVVDRLFAALEAMDAQAPAPPRRRVPPPLSAKLAEAFRAVVARTGSVDGTRCSIEETDWGTFQLRGFRAGRWKLTAQKAGWDGEMDAIQTEEIVYIIDDQSPPGAGPSDRVHEFLNLRWPAEADEFFSPTVRLTWKAERIEEAQQAVS